MLRSWKGERETGNRAGGAGLRCGRRKRKGNERIERYERYEKWCPLFSFFF